MTISASMVKELRERTGAGMMECKKALTEAGGDIEKAIEEMRKAGQAKAVKKAGRIAAEGRIEVLAEGSRAVVLEVNSETDFTASNESFKAFVREVAHAAHANAIDDVVALADAKLSSGETVEETRKALVAKIGENMTVRRVNIIEGQQCHLGSYSHGARIGVVVKLEGGSEELARDLAMHIAASSPQYIQPEDVPADVQDKEREIFIAQSQDSGKPQDIIEKMTEGRIRKFLDEISLTGQAFVKDPNQKVGAILKANNAKVIEFIRFEVGEGIEKEESNFAEEVMAQARGA